MHIFKMKLIYFYTLIILQLLIANLELVAGDVNDKSKVEAFFDEWLVEMMENEHVPGAVVAVVKDGSIQILKGYGYADLKNKRPMDPAKTRIRVGSISKLVTATAVIQLYERNQLDMDTDITEYIEPDILQEYNNPITLHHLLTHTGGLGERFFGQTVMDSKDLLPLGQFLREEMPPPLANPGEVINYSNYGISLAGYVVEKVSRQPFAEYAHDNIFSPLGMSQTSFIPPEEWDAEVALGYNYLMGKYRELPRGHWKPYPASSLITTAQDMALFMKAHLNYEASEINESEQKLYQHAESLKLVHEEHHTLNPHLPGIAYGFWAYEDNDQHLLWHTGHMPGHRSALILMPEHRLGVFLNYNADPKFLNEFLSNFLQRFFPTETAVTKTSNETPPAFDTLSYTGTYRHNWYPRTSPGKACALVGIQGKEIRVTATDHKALLIDGVLSQPIGADLFVQTTDNKIVAFVRNNENATAHLYLGGVEVYNKIAWINTAWFHRGLIAGIIIIFAFSTLICFLIFIKTRNKSNENEIPPKLRSIRRYATLVAGAPLVFFIGIFILTSLGSYKMVEEMPKALYGLLCVPFFAMAACVGLIYHTATTWKSSYFQNREKAFVFFLLIGILIFAWGLNHWNYLGFQF
jgi:CubicO group peptidase (beta-lactamase class C family)